MRLKDISYGITSAVITSLAIIIALSGTKNYTITIITALLIIAIADNISDSFGIHIYQESEAITNKEVIKTTTNNFISRVITVAIFISFIIIFPINLAIICSILFGLILIGIISYYISKQNKSHIYLSLLKHIVMTILIIISSFILREIISKYIIKLL